MDWNLIKTFIAVAEHGSLSRAGVALQISQPTVGRHVQTLQEQLGVELFVRHARGVRLSEHGESLYDSAQEVRRSVARFDMSAQTFSDACHGTVRISAARVVADYVLPTALKTLREVHPELELEVVAEDEMANLIYRDVDIAIRMAHPAHDTLFGRQVASATIGIYAARSYLDAHPSPVHIHDFAGHTVLGYDALPHGVDAMRGSHIHVEREDFVVRSDAQTFHVQGIVQGLGIGAVQDAIASRYGLVRLDVELDIPTLPVWLLTHESLRQSGRVRAAMKSLGQSIEAFYA